MLNTLGFQPLDNIYYHPELGFELYPYAEHVVINDLAMPYDGIATYLTKKHGETREYKKGCRCALCRKANTEYKRSITPPKPRKQRQCGTMSKYNGGCRCDLCTAATTIYRSSREIELFNDFMYAINLAKTPQPMTTFAEEFMGTRSARIVYQLVDGGYLEQTNEGLFKSTGKAEGAFR